MVFFLSEGQITFSFPSSLSCSNFIPFFPFYGLHIVQVLTPGFSQPHVKAPPFFDNLAHVPEALLHHISLPKSYYWA